MWCRRCSAGVGRRGVQFVGARWERRTAERRRFLRIEPRFVQRFGGLVRQPRHCDERGLGIRRKHGFVGRGRDLRRWLDVEWYRRRLLWRQLGDKHKRKLG